MNTQIFAYKGVVGAITDIENGEFINDVQGPGQLGCVIDTKNVDITKEAKELIRNAPREGGSFADIMLTEHGDGNGSSIGLMGFGLHVFTGDSLVIGRTCTTSVLDDANEVEIELDPDFKKFVDTEL